MSTITSNIHDPVDRLAEDFLVRYRRGERPSVSDYAKQFPDVADQVVDVIQVLLLMENLGAEQSSSQENEIGTVPEQLGEFRILRELGRGGMGVVYEAIQEELGRHVAIKVLPSPALLKTTQLERFKREAKTAARLHHTNIVPVFGVGVENGIHYYAMQYIEGQGLDSVLKEVRKQREESDANATLRDAAATTQQSTISGHSSRHDYARSVARIGLQMAEALAHAHAQGVLHRDVKPSNILLDQEGRAWLSDFGLAQLDASDQLTGTGEIVGTLRYMAPERFNRAGDARSDVYSLGMTLYELLSLQSAFHEVDRAKLIHQILKEEPATLRKIDPAMPRDLETIIHKAITKEPELRYQTSNALAEDLHRFLEDRPVAARRLYWWELAGRWVRRNQALSLTAAVAFAALLVGLAMTTWQWWRAEEFATTARDAVKVAENQTRIAQSNAELAWKSYRSVIDGLSNADSAMTAGLKKQVLKLALAMHREYLDKVHDLPTSLEMAKIARDLGVLYHATGERNKALEYHHTATAIFETVLQAQPENLDVAYSAAYSFEALANCLLLEARATNNSAKEAVVAAQRSVDLLRPLAQAHPSNRNVSASLIRSLNTLASVNHKVSGAWEANLQEAARYIELLGPIPGQLTLTQQTAIAASHKTYATLLYLEKKSLDQALTKAQTAYQIALPLAQHQAYAEDVQNLFYECSSILGTLLNNRKDYARAEALYRESVRVCRSLLLHDGNNARFHSDLGAELNNLAIALGNQSKEKEALEMIEEAISEQRIALRQFPSHKVFNDFLCRHYKLKSIQSLKIGDHLQGADSANQLAASARTGASYPFDAALLFCKAADLATKDQKLSEKDRLKAAKQYYDQAMVHLKTAVKRGFAEKTKLQSDSFRGLKDREDYKQLLAEMSAGSAISK